MAKVVIIGGGAAGMMAAVSASQNADNEVILLERKGLLDKGDKYGKGCYNRGWSSWYDGGCVC